MRIIAHLDMDAFFASVEERERPYLKGQPIAVGADPQGGKGRGVISTANYPARAYGIKSATPIRKAWELSEAARKKGLPPVVFVSGSFRKYSDISKKIMRIALAYLKETEKNLFEKEAPKLEQVSVDECFFDLSFAGTFPNAKRIAERIKKDILKKERLSCSIGIGPNKLVAKIASDFQKPNGLTVVTDEQAAKFLEPLSVRKIPGVGPKAEEKLARLRVRTIADGRKLSEERLKGILGKWGSELYRKLRGEDDSLVVTEPPPAKSIGEQETLPEDSLNMKVLLPYVERQARNLTGYMAKEGFKTFRTIVLTVRFADFETVSRSHTFKEPISIVPTSGRHAPTPTLEKLVWGHVTRMFFPFLDRQENPHKKKIRLVGVRVEKLA